MGLSRRNALSTPHRTGGPSGPLCSGSSCTTWMGPSEGAACASIGLHTWGSAYCAAMLMGIGVGGASCASLALLRSLADGATAPAAEDRVEARTAFTRACRSTTMAERVVRHAAAGVGDIPPAAPCPLGMTPSGRGAVDEDGKDEYRAAYLARQMSRVRPRTPGDSLPMLLGEWHG
jgi:hypothetical protein